MRSLIYLVAGEASGDVLGARLIAAMRRADRGLDFAGIGGERMAEQGMASLFPMQDLTVMGLAEVLPRLRLLRARLDETVEDILRRRPAVVVTIDSPGFCTRVLRRIAEQGIRRVHYVAPQVWAWRAGRVRHFPGLWDKLLCLLSFEPEFFAPYGLAPVFVGHPVLESGADHGNSERFRAKYGLPATARPMVLMPGSRRGEISRLMPIYGEVLRRLTDKRLDLVPVLAAAPAMLAQLEEASVSWPIKPLIITGIADRYDAFAAAAVALTKSGTATLELAMAGTPMGVTYRVNALTAMIARRMVTVQHAALVNLLFGGELVPELIQGHCSPDRLANMVASLLNDPAAQDRQIAGFAQVRASLWPKSHALPSDEAATAILELLN